MRKIATLLTCVCVSLSINTAIGQVYKFKAFNGYVGKSTLLTSDPYWTDCNILVVVNLDKEKVQIYSKTTQEYDLVGMKKSYEDENGHHWLVYSAVDNSGNKCELDLKIFKDKAPEHFATLILLYSDCTIAYRLKKND